MTIEEMRALLQQSLKPKRYEHSVRVYETALEMAEHYHADVKKVAVASLIHDCGRQISKEDSVAKAKELGIPVDPVEEAQPILLHAKLGVYYAIRKYGVSPDDREVLDAMREWKRFGKRLFRIWTKACSCLMTTPSGICWKTVC